MKKYLVSTAVALLAFSSSVTAQTMPADQAEVHRAFERATEIEAAHNRLRREQEWSRVPEPGGFLDQAEAKARRDRERDDAWQAVNQATCLRSATDWVGRGYASPAAPHEDSGSFLVTTGAYRLSVGGRIKKDSPLYQVIGRLGSGAPVRFSGKFIASQAGRGCLNSDNDQLGINFEQITLITEVAQQDAERKAAEAERRVKDEADYQRYLAKLEAERQRITAEADAYWLRFNTQKREADQAKRRAKRAAR